MVGVVIVSIFSLKKNKRLVYVQANVVIKGQDFSVNSIDTGRNLKIVLLCH